MSKEIKNDSQSFEEDLKEIEKIVAYLESGELPLEKALDMFEHGIKLIRQSQKKLNEAEQRVKILLKNEENEKLDLFFSKKT